MDRTLLVWIGAASVLVACGDDAMTTEASATSTASSTSATTEATSAGETMTTTGATASTTASTSDGTTTEGTTATTTNPTTGESTGTETDTGVDPGGFHCLYPPAAPEADFPQVKIDTTYPIVTGQTIHVAAGGDLQAALDAAAPGDEITLEAGATYSGNFTLPDKAGDGWIVVRTDDPALPPEHTRVALADAAHMPTVETPNQLSVITTQGAAHHFRFVGIHFRPADGQDVNDLITLGIGDETSVDLLPHDIIVDRCIVRGDPKVGGKRGVRLNARAVGVVDSYFTDWKREGQDTQALLGWNTPGPFRIVNNHLEGAAENMMLGGADAVIADVIPSDIEICGNTFRKPLAWKVDDPSYEGTHWSVKNLFELKVGRRVLISGNTFEQCWADAQVGFAIVLKSANQDGGQPWAVTEHVTFAYNTIRRSAHGINVSRTDGNSLGTNHMRIVGNLVTELGDAWGADGRSIQLLDGLSVVDIAHNTVLGQNQVVVFDGMPMMNLAIRDNIFGPTMYGIFGSGQGQGTTALDYFSPGGAFAGNVVVGVDPASYPAGNFYPATLGEVGFIDPMGGDYGLMPGSTYVGKATDGGDPGVSMSLLVQAQAGQG